ncbi:MAG: hypothetical protein ACR2KG_04045 [Nocardioidaceae bacterium]
MRLAWRARHIPARLATGAFILSSGLSKRDADEQTANGLFGMATNAYPFLAPMEAAGFARLLSIGEITLGTALLLPIVPTTVAAAGLAAFSGGLVGMYLRTPALHREGSVAPSQDGIAIAKDVWMLGIALGFLVDELVEARRNK